MSGEFFLARDQDLAGAAQHIAARGSRRAAPELEAALGRRDRGVDIGRARVRKAADYVPRIGGIDVVEIFAVGRRGPLAGDEVLNEFILDSC